MARGREIVLCQFVIFSFFLHCKKKLPNTIKMLVFVSTKKIAYKQGSHEELCVKGKVFCSLQIRLLVSFPDHLQLHFLDRICEL